MNKRKSDAAVIAVLNFIYNGEEPAMEDVWADAWVFKGRGLVTERKSWQHAIDGERRAMEILYDAC